ncbi:interleukin-12 receptor subunit beta-2-like [Protopterus annectens]|uniref:interleukin-12 receptor subunit beta-2-like n=1 Tax=Protopterus annectens TaxID=7888 RepID=UPI001CF96074|nr:interleukin-12 receptor subunit beta-2-like [Protopterus annectens]
MNCTWHRGRHPLIATNYTLYLMKQQQAHSKTKYPVLEEQMVSVKRSALIKSMLYLVWVEAENQLGKAVSENLTVNIDKIVMLDTPVITSFTVGENDVEVMWNIPNADQQHNGITCQVRYRKYGIAEWINLNEDAIGNQYCGLEELEAFTEYECEVRCISRTGDGLWSDWSHPLIFRSHEDAPNGTLDAWWYFQPTNSSERQELVVLWKTLKPEEARGQITNYKIQWKQGTLLDTKYLNKCCSVVLPWDTIFVNITAITAKGSTKPALLSTQLSGHLPFKMLTVVYYDGRYLKVSWPAYDNDNIRQLLVEWQKAVAEVAVPPKWTRIPPSSNSILLEDSFEKFVPYRISVYALFENGSCESLINDLVYAKQGVPSVAPSILTLIQVGSVVQIVWTEIPLELQHGFITNYNVYLCSVAPKAKVQTFKYGVRNVTMNIDPGEYEICISASTAEGEGNVSAAVRFKVHVPETDHIVLVVIISVVVILLFIFIIILLLKCRKNIHDWCLKHLPVWCCQQVPAPRCDHVQFPETLFLTSEDGCLNEEPAIVSIEEIEETPQPETMVSQNSDMFEEDYRSIQDSGSSLLFSDSENSGISTRQMSAECAPPAPFSSGYEKHFMPVDI